jgi:hypothetical protein
MNKIFYAGIDGQPCFAEYQILIDDSDWIQKASIVVVQSTEKGVWTSLHNTDTGRDNILNRILNQELSGIRTEFISFNIIIDTPDRIEGLRLPIRVDIDDYISKKNRHSSWLARPQKIIDFFRILFGRGTRYISYNSVDVVGGCAKFYTDYNDEKRQHLNVSETSKLLQQVGYVRPSYREKRR